MAYQERSGFCDTCKKQVMVRRAGTSHLLHLILTCLTMGLWLIVWLLSSVKVGGWRCTNCGSVVKKNIG